MTRIAAACAASILVVLFIATSVAAITQVNEGRAVRALVREQSTLIAALRNQLNAQDRLLRATEANVEAWKLLVPAETRAAVENRLKAAQEAKP